MKKLRYLREAKELEIEVASHHDGCGEIHMPAWNGSVIWGDNEDGWEHVSVSPYRGIMPSWDDMCRIKDIFWDAEEGAIQIHPKKSQYVNLVNNCLHIWRPIDPELCSKLEL